MTRKDYIALAGAIREAMRTAKPLDKGDRLLAVLIIENVMGVLKADNPAFSHDKFVEAVRGAE